MSSFGSMCDPYHVNIKSFSINELKDAADN